MGVAKRSSSPELARETGRRIGWAVSAVSRIVPGATCLAQALAAEYLLVGAGCPAVLHIGARNDEASGFEAHAWVVSDGEIIVGDVGVDRFTPLEPSPPE